MVIRSRLLKVRRAMRYFLKRVLDYLLFPVSKRQKRPRQDVPSEPPEKRQKLSRSSETAVIQNPLAIEYEQQQLQQDSALPILRTHQTQLADQSAQHLCPHCGNDAHYRLQHSSRRTPSLAQQIQEYNNKYQPNFVRSERSSTTPSSGMPQMPPTRSSTPRQPSYDREGSTSEHLSFEESSPHEDLSRLESFDDTDSLGFSTPPSKRRAFVIEDNAITGIANTISRFHPEKIIGEHHTPFQQRVERLMREEKAAAKSAMMKLQSTSSLEVSME